MPDVDTIKKSVTKDDYQEGRSFILWVGSPRTTAMPPTLEGLGLAESDAATSQSPDFEAIWAGALAIAITKVTSLSWEIEGDIPLRTRRTQELLQGLDAGRGWVSGMSKLLQDFLLTNNGAFLEVVRATSSVNSQIVGLIPLDSLRCQRTGDPSRPVIYTDLLGRMHELRAEDVIEFADMPSSRASMFGSGKCAAFRAWRAIYKLASIEQYISDKVTGRRPLSLELISGLNDPQLRTILNTGQAEADARGMVAFMGAVLGTVMSDNLNHVSVPLAGLPENFDRQKELDIAVLGYVNNLGLDVQDVQPLTGRAIGTGAQSDVLNEKAKGKGLSAFRQQFTHALNEWVLPDMTTFVFVEKDWRDKNLGADFAQKTEAYVADSVSKGILTGAQGLQKLVDENVYPKEFLPEDETPDTTLADDEKPDEGAPAAPPPPGAPSPAAPSADTGAIPRATAEDIARLRIPKVAPITKEKTPKILEETAPDALNIAKRIRKRHKKEEHGT